MKRKFTLLLMAALLAVGGVQAQKPVRKYFWLNDSFCWLDESYATEKYKDPETGEEKERSIGEDRNSKNAFTGAIHLEWNTKVGWTLPNKDLSEYTSLVVNLKEPADKDLFVTINDEGTFWPFEKNSKSVLAAGETSITITLNTLTHNLAEGDGNALNLENVVGITLFNQNANYAACDYVFESMYLEKTIGAEDAYTAPFDFSNLTYKAENTSFNADTYTFTFNGGSYGGWQWDTPQNWSDYKYLVVIPQKQWSIGNIHCSYVLEDNASHVIDDGIMRWGEWNRARAAVLDLTTVKTTVFETGGGSAMDFDIKNITKFYFRPIWGGSGDFGVAAVFLTNNAPVCGDNHDNASNNANYKREYTAKDKWGTVCLPYNAAVCGAEVYEVVGVDDLDDPKALYLDNVKFMMKAGKSYIFKNTADNLDSYQNDKGETVETNFKLANVTFYQVGEDEACSPTGNNLIGTFIDETTVPNGSYILKNGEWKMSAGTAKVNANRAYLTLTESLVVPDSEVKAKGYITMNLWDDTATNISLTPTTSPVGEGNSRVIYNLAGQRLSKLQKGINIVNGKKVVVK